MDLSIIIVNWNTRDLLAQCLQSLCTTCQGLTQPAAGDLRPSSLVFGCYCAEVFVVDNASSDGSVQMVQARFPWVHLIENRENVGFACANNQAIRQSRGRYLLLLNSDAQLVPGAISNMVQFLDTNPAAGIASVCLAFPDRRPQFCYGSFPSLYTEFRSLFGLHRWDLSFWGKLDVPREVDWVSGACLMARKTMLDQIDLLDESFFMFGEEVDLCYRAVQAGWKVCLVPSPPVIHVRAGSTGKTSDRILRLHRAKLWYFRKHLGNSRTALLVVMILASTLAKLTFYSALSVLRPQLAQRRRLWWRVLKSILRKDSFRHELSHAAVDRA